MHILVVACKKTDIGNSQLTGLHDHSIGAGFLSRLFSSQSFFSIFEIFLITFD